MDIGNLQVRVALAGVGESIAGLTALQKILRDIQMGQASPVAKGGLMDSIKGLSSSVGAIMGPITGLTTAILGVAGAFGILDKEVEVAKFAIGAYSDARALQLTSARMLGKEAGEKFYQGMLSVQKQSVMDVGALQKFALSMIGNRMGPGQAIKLTLGMQDIFAAGGFVNMSAANQALWQVTEMLDEGKLTLRHLRSLLRGAPGLLKWMEEAGGWKTMADFTGQKSISSDEFIKVLEKIANRQDVKGAAQQMANEIPDLAWQQFINKLKIDLVPLGGALSKGLIPILKQVSELLADPIVIAAITAFANELKFFLNIVQAVSITFGNMIRDISSFIRVAGNALASILNPVYAIYAAIRRLVDTLNEINGNNKSAQRPITAADRARAYSAITGGALMGA